MSLLFITGAGISAPSGIPTYRAAYGDNWEDTESMDLVNASSLSTKEGYLKVKDYLNNWKSFVSDKEPNRGHYVIKELLDKYDGALLTQNVDNLHEKAGSTSVEHLHGSLFLDREGEPGFPDVVLFGEDVKDISVTTDDKLDDISVTILVGCSGAVTTLFWYIDWDKPVVVCNLEDEEFPHVPEDSTVYYFPGDFSLTADKLEEFLLEKDLI